MDNEKSPVTTLVQECDAEKLALPSNFRYGQAIFSRQAVELIRADDAMIEAWVGGLNGTVAEGGGSRRRVQFTATPSGLGWHCTGNPSNHQIFCKHCVALALAMQNGLLDKT